MPVSRSSAVLDVEAEAEPIDRPREPEEPFRILLLGDFSGRATRRIVMLDRDNFDDVLSDLAPELRLGSLHLNFRELEDFHPDAIYRQADRFEDLAPPPVSETNGRPTPNTGSSLLDQIVEQNSEPTPPEYTGDLAAFIEKSMRGQLEPKATPAEKARASKTESASSAAMRAILHDPKFQALEAAWRAAFLLARGLETDEDLKLYLLDITLEEIVADPAAFLELITGAKQKWALLVGNFVFGQARSDARILEFLAGVAQRAQAPFLAEAQLPGEAVSPEWKALRKSPHAPWIGLALPRFLLRLPYGKDTSPIESFSFEEMPESRHQQYLWGNPAFLCSYLIGKSFVKDGWNMRLGSVRRLDGMPVHVYKEDGESQMKPCAEVLMTEKQADLILDQGIMPVASLKHQDAVLLVRFQSIAEPPGALAGRWSKK